MGRNWQRKGALTTVEQEPLESCMHLRGDVKSQSGMFIALPSLHLWVTVRKVYLWNPLLHVGSNFRSKRV